MKNILAFTLFITLALTACKKEVTEPVDPNQLPPTTETGANTVACKVNGANHIYKSTKSLFSQNGVAVVTNGIDIDNDQFIEIKASDTKYDDYISIKIVTKGWKIEVGKEYNISNEQKDVGKYYTNDELDSYTTQFHTGKLTFTKFNDKIVAGRFSFKAYKLDMSDSVNITEGFFDISVSSTE